MRVRCCICGRQVIPVKIYGWVSDKYKIDADGAKAGFKSNEVFCRECGKDLDENGLFPEERERL